MRRLTRFSLHHRRAVGLAWLFLLLAAVGLMAAVPARDSTTLRLPGTGSQRAGDLLRERFPAAAGDRDQLVFHARSGTLRSASGRRAIDGLLGRVARLPHVVSVVSPYAGRGSLSRDAKIGFATVTFDRSYESIPRGAVDAVVHAAEAARTPALQVEAGGPAVTNAQNTGGLGPATAVGIVAAVAILLLSFGSLLAMGLPIATALFGLGVGLSLVALASRVLDIAGFAPQLAIMIGLGVGVDYALLIVTRYRDAYGEHQSVELAVEQAMDTAGRSVLFAGSTVVVALLGLFAVQLSVLDGVAVAAAVAVLVVMAAAVTLLPVLLSLTGRRVGASRRRRQRHPEAAERGLWLRWVAAIQRRPLLYAVGSTALLLALAAPALGLRLGTGDAGNDPTSATTRRAYDLLSQGFGPGANGPLLLAVRLPAAGQGAGLAGLRGAVAATPDVAAVGRPRVDAAGETAVLLVQPSSAPQSDATSRLVEHLRSDVLPPVEAATGVHVEVGGVTATQVDFAHVLGRKLPLFVAVVVLLSALLLLVAFRSLVIPLQAAAMNLLSIAAALGIVQAVFERGWLIGLLGVQRGPIEPYIPIIVFAIVFGLSMDYEVFLVSRIHEEWLRRQDASAAVRVGLARTGRVVTAAAAVMVAVFTSFVLGDLRVIKLFGLALSSAVLLDAVVIRSVLLPAVLELLGRRTWVFPGWLNRRLPRLALEPAPVEEPGYD